MSQGDDGARAPLNHMRDMTIDSLMEHFANDAIDVARLSGAHVLPHVRAIDQASSAGQARAEFHSSEKVQVSTIAPCST